MRRGAVDVVYLAISKTFRFVSCRIVISNLYGLNNRQQERPKDCKLAELPSQKVVISTTKSYGRPVAGDVHCRLMLASVPFNILISDHVDWFDWVLSMFVDDTKLGRMHDTPDGCAYHTW